MMTNGELMYYTVKKAYFPYNLILWVFWKINGGNSDVNVAMIDPFKLEILTLHPPYILLAEMYKHERRHINQVKEQGKIKFVLKYLWYNIRYGYRNNPFEVEARKYESLPLID